MIVLEVGTGTGDNVGEFVGGFVVAFVGGFVVAFIGGFVVAFVGGFVVAFVGGFVVAFIGGFVVAFVGGFVVAFVVAFVGGLVVAFVGGFRVVAFVGGFVVAFVEEFVGGADGTTTQILNDYQVTSYGSLYILLDSPVPVLIVMTALTLLSPFLLTAVTENMYSLSIFNPVILYSYIDEQCKMYHFCTENITF